MELLARFKLLQFADPRIDELLQRDAPPGMQGLYRVICGKQFDLGRGPEWCPQELGWAQPAAFMALGKVAAAMRWAAGEPLPTEEDWTMVMAGHYRREPDGAYVQFRRKSKLHEHGWRRSRARSGSVGRRPLPANLRQAIKTAGISISIDEVRSVFGHVPVLPAILICPRCGARNLVERPPPVPVNPPRPPTPPLNESIISSSKTSPQWPGVKLVPLARR